MLGCKSCPLGASNKCNDILRITLSVLISGYQKKPNIDIGTLKLRLVGLAGLVVAGVQDDRPEKGVFAVRPELERAGVHVNCGISLVQSASYML